MAASTGDDDSAGDAFLGGGDGGGEISEDAGSWLSRQAVVGWFAVVASSFAGLCALNAWRERWAVSKGPVANWKNAEHTAAIAPPVDREFLDALDTVVEHSLVSCLIQPIRAVKGTRSR
jgi:hypothetical protein